MKILIYMSFTQITLHSNGYVAKINFTARTLDHTQNSVYSKWY